MLEIFLLRIASSPYKDSFILKGGFLISSIVGIQVRSTMDIDVTIKGKHLSLTTIEKIISEIIDYDNEIIIFKLYNIKNIREHDIYNGFRVSILASYDYIKVPFKIDITTGDKITPREINFSYNSIFNNEKVAVLAYNIETVLAEKLETIVIREESNTRSRDFYDVYVLTKFYFSSYQIDVLKSALINTSTKRGSLSNLYNYQNILNNIINNDRMITQWNVFLKEFNYDNNLTFNEVCSCIIGLLDELFK